MITSRISRLKVTTVTSILVWLVMTVSIPAEPETHEVIPDPTPTGPITYINEDSPAVDPPEYPGKYYDAMVPATFDLAERARLALNYLTRFVNPNLEYEPYNMIELMSQPPKMWHQQGDFQMQGKVLEILPISRLVSGSQMNLEVDEAYMNMFLKMQGPDGLPYAPTKGRPWVLDRGGYLHPPDDQKEGVDQICTLGYGTSRALSAFSVYAKLDPDGPFPAAARKLAEGIKKTLIVDGPNAYMFGHWTVPGRTVEKPEKPPVGIIAGGNAWTAQALIQYHRALGDPEALELAGKILHFIMIDSGYFLEDGRFQSNSQGSPWAHFHTHAMGILATLYYIEETGDRTLLDIALKAYEYGIRAGNGVVGFFPEATHNSGPEFKGDEHPYKYHTSEICEVVDMIICAIKFSKLGIDKWDDADRWLRNQFAESQLTSVNWLKDGHVDYSKAVVKQSHKELFYRLGQYTSDNVADRAVGGFSSHPSANDFIGHPEFIVSIANCCSGNGPRALYYAWREALTFDRGGMIWMFDRPTLRVNLLFNRASDWADIDSHIPYSGRVDVMAKMNIIVEIRLPDYAEPGEASCEVDGKPRELTFKGRYALVGEVDKDQVATLNFPIPVQTHKVLIQGPPAGEVEYTLVMRGNSVVSIDPPGEYMPYYQRGHYRTGETLYRKVTRYIPKDQLDWW
jgi:hypothetical protein